MILISTTKLDVSQMDSQNLENTLNTAKYLNIKGLAKQT